VFRVGVYNLSSFPSTAECFDLNTGVPLWAVPVPIGPSGGGRGRCLGVDHGRVYVTRGDNIVALSVLDGSIAWMSALTFVSPTIVGAHVRNTMDLVFEPSGDLFVDAVENVLRLRGSDGVTLWDTPRPNAATGGVGGHGVVLSAGAVYAIENTYSIASGLFACELVKLDLASRSLLYGSGPLGSGWSSCPPFIGRDGAAHIVMTEYASLPAMPELATVRDNGAAFVPLWTVPTTSLTATRHATCSDGSVLHAVLGSGTNFRLQKLDRSTGAVVATSAALSLQTGPDFTQLAVDGLDRVFVTNSGSVSGGGPPVMITSELDGLKADLSPAWNLLVSGVSFGAPALASSGTLVVVASGSVRAFRSPHSTTTTYCDSTTTTCPCSAGYFAHGCPNSQQLGGAHLASDGVASTTSDTLQLHVVGATNGPCMFLQGTVASGPGLPFGDGNLCVLGTITRLGVVFASDSRATFPSAGGTPLSISGQIPPAGPSTRHYQAWYRDVLVFCGTATFNLSNALTVVWP